MSKHINQRAFDLILSITALVLLLPIFLIFYPLLVLSIGNPVIFKQKRIGKNKKVFTIYKIRTMKLGSEKLRNKPSKTSKKLEKINIAPYPMFKTKNDPRFNKPGKMLSKFGVDELPQLVNIAKGEMSLVGPRPLPVNEAMLLDSSWDFRYGVRPGILSEWALSTKRYKSLETWKKLDRETVEQKEKWDVFYELGLMKKAFVKIVVKQF